MRDLSAFILALALLLTPAAAAGPTLTRGDFVVLLWRSAGGVPMDVTAHPFRDLPEGDDTAQAVAWACSLGLVKGVGGDRVAPDRPLTRAECAVLLRRNDARRGRDVFLPDGATLCNDYEGFSPWAGDDLSWACITGRLPWRDGRLAPLDTVTLQEAEDSLS